MAAPERASPSPVTLLRPQVAVPGGGHGAGNLPRELVDAAAQRVAFVAALFGGVYLPASTTAALVFQGLGGDARGWDVWHNLAIGVPWTAGSFFVWWWVRRPGLAQNRIILAALGYQLFICLLSTLPHWLVHPNYEHDGLTWVTVIIVGFPLLVPARPRQVVVTSLLCAAFEPICALIWAVIGERPDSYGELATRVIGNMAATLLAWAGARVVWGLTTAVGEARALGSYRLVERIGAGGMGEVWRAEHRLLAVPAAIKLVQSSQLGRDGDGTTPHALQRFEREARATATLRSPHTVELYDFGLSDDGVYYYVMELLQGEDLQQLVEREGALPPQRAVRLLRQACLSLAEAHDAGLVHRDIKPANLFAARAGIEADFVKVLDFGLVKPQQDKSSPRAPTLTHEDTITGTPAYLSPEAVLGDRALDGRSDLYALGCVAWWLLSGRTVFEDSTAMGVAIKHAQTAPDDIRDHVPAPIPDALADLVMSSIAKDPAARPQDARAMLDALDAVALALPRPEDRT